MRVPRGGPVATTNHRRRSDLLGARCCFLGACAALFGYCFFGSGGCRPPPPVAAPLASSLRAPSRGDPPLNFVPLPHPPPDTRCELSAPADCRTKALEPSPLTRYGVRACAP